MRGLGGDGRSEEKMGEFEEVGGVLERNGFVRGVVEDIKVKREVGKEVIEGVKNLL